MIRKSIHSLRRWAHGPSGPSHAGSQTTLHLENLEERVLLWSALLGYGGYPYVSGARAVAVAPDNNIVAAGSIPAGADFFSVVKLDGQDGTVLWRPDLCAYSICRGYAKAVAVDAAGDVVAAGEVWTSPSFHFGIVKLSGEDGSVLWHSDVTSLSTLGSIADVRFDSVGDVIAVGYSISPDTGFDFAVVKLRGSDGVEVWRQTLTGAGDSGPEAARSVRIDANGDVVVAGSLQRVGQFSDFVVVKFAGSDGIPLWQHDLRGADPRGDNVATGLSIDAAGDVVAAGYTSNLPFGITGTVAKLQGVDGAQLWMNEPISVRTFNTVAIDANGDVFTSTDFTVHKWSGADGTQLWSNFSIDVGTQLTLDSAGNVVAVGKPFGVAKLQGEDGAVLWRSDLGNVFDEALAVAVDGSDDVIAGGYDWVSKEEGVRFFVAKLNGSDGNDFGGGGFPGGWPGPASHPNAIPHPGSAASLGVQPPRVAGVDWVFAADGPKRLEGTLELPEKRPTPATWSIPGQQTDAPLWETMWLADGWWFPRERAGDWTWGLAWRALVGCYPSFL